jgi:hypothetical protein
VGAAPLLNLHRRLRLGLDLAFSGLRARKKFCQEKSQEKFKS